MIISNQIEHLRNLYKELNYLEVIHFGTITLPISLDEKRYDAELIELGVTPIFKLGIAFSGKRVKIKTM